MFFLIKKKKIALDVVSRRKQNKLTLVDCWLHYMISFKPHDNPMRWMLMLVPYYRGKKQAQRDQLTCPRAHSELVIQTWV